MLVNAVSIREGGPRVTVIKLLSRMAASSPDTVWSIAAPADLAKECNQMPQTTAFAVSADRSPVHLSKWYEFGLSATARRWKADVVFSVTNYLPFRRLPLPTLLLEQHAGHFSAEFDRLIREATPFVLGRMLWQWKTAWVRNSVKSATVLTVQTQTLADAIVAATGRSRNTICVIPHGPGWVERREQPRARHEGGKWRIGYISKWGVQKNFLTLFKAIEKLSSDGLPICLVLTLDPTHEPAAQVLRLARQLGIESLIENHGEVAGESIASLYDGLDLFAFPSICESFGMPMVEAMARGLPIVVADTPENREITGDAGVLFAAYDANSLTAILARLMNDTAEREMRANRSLIRAHDFSWDKAAEATLAALATAAGGVRV